MSKRKKLLRAKLTDFEVRLVELGRVQALLAGHQSAPAKAQEQNASHPRGGHRIAVVTLPLRETRHALTCAPSDRVCKSTNPYIQPLTTVSRGVHARARLSLPQVAHLQKDALGLSRAASYSSEITGFP